MDAGHQDAERCVDHLMPLDQGLALERRAHDGDGEVIAGPGRVLGGDLRVGECRREARTDLVGMEHPPSYNDGVPDWQGGPRCGMLRGP